MSATFFHSSRVEYQYLDFDEQWKTSVTSWSKPEGPTHLHHMKETRQYSAVGKARCINIKSEVIDQD